MIRITTTTVVELPEDRGILREISIQQRKLMSDFSNLQEKFRLLEAQGKTNSDAITALATAYVNLAASATPHEDPAVQQQIDDFAARAQTILDAETTADQAAAAALLPPVPGS